MLPLAACASPTNATRPGEDPGVAVQSGLTPLLTIESGALNQWDVTIRFEPATIGALVSDR